MEDEDKKPADILVVLPLKRDEEVKEEKRIKILTLNKPLTRLPVLLAQIKDGINSYEL